VKIVQITILSAP